MGGTRDWVCKRAASRRVLGLAWRPLPSPFALGELSVGDSSRVMTRLDRWYVPATEEFAHYLWDIEVLNDLVWSENNKDHLPVVLTVEANVGERGHDRETARADMCFETGVQKEIMSITDRA